MNRLTYGGPFTYSGLVVSGRTISFKVTSSGTGCDTPQLYLSAPTAATDPALPLKTMRNFQKVCGTAQQAITFEVADADVSVWEGGAWQVVRGTWGVSVGASSADIRLTGTLTV